MEDKLKHQKENQEKDNSDDNDDIEVVCSL